MTTLSVVNIKCGGCARRITDRLTSMGCTDVEVDVASQTVSFVGDVGVATDTLLAMGYPLADTPAAHSLTKKAVSFVSCAIGNIS